LPEGRINRYKNILVLKAEGMHCGTGKEKRSICLWYINMLKKKFLLNGKQERSGYYCLDKIRKNKFVREYRMPSGRKDFHFGVWKILLHFF